MTIICLTVFSKVATSIIYSFILSIGMENAFAENKLLRISFRIFSHIHIYNVSCIDAGALHNRSLLVTYAPTNILNMTANVT